MTATSDGNGSPFSDDYAAARARFRRAAEARGFRLDAFPIDRAGPSGEALTIDAAVLGPERPGRVLVVSSGLHGVEGFFGSAAQLAWLEGEGGGRRPAVDGAVVLLHALDPFGFAWGRRFDEGNVDLNRNFLVNGEPFRGTPPHYALLNGLLNPEGPPRGFDLFYLRAFLAVLRYGNRDLKQAVARGQYDFPLGLFFGGNGPSRVRRVLEENLPRWLAGAERVLHLDFHTGLGPWGTYRLLVEPEVGPDRLTWLREWFGAERVEANAAEGISYVTRGDIGSWCRATFPGTVFDSVCAEFGTYPPVRVLAALRAENRAFHWLDDDDPARLRAARRLKETFAPADPSWRAATVGQAVGLVGRGFDALFGGPA